MESEPSNDGFSLLLLVPPVKSASSKEKAGLPVSGLVGTSGLLGSVGSTGFGFTVTPLSVPAMVNSKLLESFAP